MSRRRVTPKTPARRHALADAQLAVAIAAGRIRDTQRALAAGASPSMSTHASHALLSAGRPLHRALALGHDRIATLLVAAGADLRGRDPDRQTALHLAAQRGSVPMVRLLLRAGADPLGDDGSGRTAFDHALRHDHARCASVLLDALPPALPRSGDDDTTPLRQAVRFRARACVTLLLRRGVDLNAVHTDGCTPLFDAVVSPLTTPAFIAFLLARGADPAGAPRTPRHDTPLSCAIDRSEHAIAVLLLAAGAPCTPGVVHAVDDSTPESIHFLMRALRTAVGRGRIPVAALAPLLSATRAEVRTAVLLLIGTKVAAPRRRAALASRGAVPRR